MSSLRGTESRKWVSGESPTYHKLHYAWLRAVTVGRVLYVELMQRTKENQTEIYFFFKKIEYWNHSSFLIKL